MTEPNTTPQEPTSGNGSASIEPVETIESVKEQLDKTSKLLEDVQKAQKGSDSKVTEYAGIIEELRNSLKTKMSEKELKELEVKEKDERLLKLDADFKQLKADRDKDKLDTFKLKTMAEHGLNIKFANFINGNSEDEITANIEIFKVLNEEQLKAAKIDLVNGKPPQGGATETTGQQMDRADFDKLDPIQRGEVMKKGTKIIE